MRAGEGATVLLMFVNLLALFVSYYIIRLLGLVGLVWDIREPTEKALAANRIEMQEPTSPRAS